MAEHGVPPAADPRSLTPFGLGVRKPKHFRDMAGVVWKNRDNLGYAWKVLSRGVCDGCALGVAGFHDWTIDGVHLCMTRLNLLRLNTMPAMDHERLADLSTLAPLDNRQLRDLGRLAHPMRRRRGESGFTRVSWDEALAAIGRRIQKADAKRLAFFLTSRGITNEVYYAAQKVARFLGTNNIDNAARLCHAPSTAAMKQTLGVAATTCSYTDWIGSDLIVFFGANPANDQPVTTKYLHVAKKAGTRVILVNPYLEPGMVRYWVPSTVSSALFGTKITDEWFRVSQGGDIAFLYGALKRLLERDAIDHAFIDAHTSGFEAVAAKARALSWDELERSAGLPRESMEAFADRVAQARTAVFVWSMGLTQHPWGADNVRMVLNLALTRGFIGRDKCGVMPIRGHSSVQGGAEMGAYATALPGGKPVNEENAAALETIYQFPIDPRPGLSTTEMIEAAHRGELDVLYALGGNFLRTLPDPEHVTEALARVPLRVHQDIIVNDQMLIEPGEEVYLLPARTRYEQDDGGTETTTERRVIFTPEIPREVGEARAEWRILLEVAKAAKPESAHKLGFDDGWAMREEIARVVPFYAGIEKLRQSGDQFQYGGPHLCANGRFATSDGRAHVVAPGLPDIAREPGVFHVATRRGKQFNTLIYADVDPFNGAPRDAVLMCEEDAARLYLKSGDRVTLVNELGRLDCVVQIALIAEGSLQVHWPEGNVLIRHDVLEPGGLVPDYNALVRIENGDRQ
ncbi:MAG: FdhF/YdeP family oxidoreductase [Opitutaceae bacterium]